MNRREFIHTATSAGLTSAIASNLLNGCSSALSVSKNLGGRSQNTSDRLSSLADISLKQAAKAAGKLYGAAISEAELETDPAYAALIARECSIATPNGALKWVVCQPRRGEFDFGMADKVINFCSKNNIKLRGHTFLWHIARPNWLPYPASLADMEKHIGQVMGRYRNNKTIVSWDIANEVIADRAEDTSDQVYGLRKGVKPEYIRDVFKIAASVDRSKEFVINEFGIEDTGWKQEKFLNLIKYLKKSGVKLDAVGIQSHMWFSTAYNWNSQGFLSFLNKLRNLGVKPIVTELDIIIDLPLPKTLAELDTMVAENYKRYLDICFQGGVNTIITWGITDKYSWLRHPDWMPTKLASYLDFIRPLPYDGNLQPKLARDYILQSFPARK